MTGIIRRYTIIEELPYDRHNTTMKDFELCTSCSEEYSSPKSRRFHAQTIACNDCGPYLIYQDRTLTVQGIQPDHKNSSQAFRNQTDCNKTRINQTGCYSQSKNSLTLNNQSHGDLTQDKLDHEALEASTAVIRSGGIVAVKGIGGYHLVCSPFNDETVQRLRKLKGREEKPFAVMFPDIQTIEEYCLVSGEEKALLLTKARPIVLLYMHTNSLAPSVNKGSIYCGAFLPYTPLQILLTGMCGPLIMTSANISDQPIIREDERMLSLASPLLDGVLYNTRRIIRSVDDSVAKIIDGKPQLIRRSRGYVPYPVYLNLNHKRIFAAGGDLKAAFCLFHHENAVVSQHFGDLEEVSVMEEYQKSYADLARLLKITPSLAVCDLHPNYHSVRFTKSLGIPFLQVQHHHAHIASVMAEHDLQGRIIGVAFDGTGYGTDGNVWGGEFLVCEGAEFVRAAHLEYVPMLGGDQSMKDARKTADCYLLSSGLEDQVKDERKQLIKAALDNKINTVLNSSMGRLFDAVASILDICQENRYEGEGAALLEKEAVLAARNNYEPAEVSFAIEEKNAIIEITSEPVLKALCLYRGQTGTGSLALGFHYAVADMMVQVCNKLREKYQSSTVALSGGVFQNTVLTEKALDLLRENDFEVYVNIAVPPNDGGISLGQAYIAAIKEV